MTELAREILARVTTVSEMVVAFQSEERRERLLEAMMATRPDLPGLWLLGREGPLTADRRIGAARNQERVPYGQLMSSRTFIGCVLIGFLAYWLVTIAVVWLPAYLEKGLGYSASEAGWIVTIAPLCQIVLMPGICSLSELLTRNGASSRPGAGSGCGAVCSRRRIDDNTAAAIGGASPSDPLHGAGLLSREHDLLSWTGHDCRADIR